jgi:archaellum component FlaC
VDQQTFYIVVTVAAAVITLSFVVQAVMFAYINANMKKLNQVAGALQTKVEPLLGEVQSTVANVKGVTVQARDAFENLTAESRAIAAAISVSTREITEVARTQAQHFAGTLEETNLMLRRQVTELDHLLSRTQLRIEDTTIEVQTSVLKPLRELAAVVAGVRRTVDVLLNRDRKPIDQVYQDEEMFI